MQNVYFTWDTSAIITTVFIGLLFIAILALSIKYRGIIRWVLLTISAVAFIVPLFLFPLYVTKQGTQICIHSIGRSTTLNLEDYTIERCDSMLTKEWSRTFASDGYLGYWGNWRHHSGERYTFYLTNRTKNVFLLHPKHGGRSVAINLPKEWMK